MVIILTNGVFIIDMICGGIGGVKIGTALGIQMYIIIGMGTAGIHGIKHLIIRTVEEAQEVEVTPVYIPILIEQIGLDC